MPFHCFKCQTKQPIDKAREVAFRDSCIQCGSDLHVCLNCIHYDSGAYNGCKELQAERVVEKDRGNLCEYFVFREGREHLRAPEGTKSGRMKRLDDLFKK